MFNWKVTYMDYNGRLVAITYCGDLYGLAQFYPPNSNGPQSIIKAEKVSEA